MPVKYPPNVKLENILTTLECQREFNYAYLDARGHWGFYSSEVLPPFLVTQVLSLQDSSSRNLKRGGQVILPWRTLCFKVLLHESSNAFPYSYWVLILRGVLYKGWARLSFGPWTQIHQALSSVFILFTKKSILGEIESLMGVSICLIINFY